MNVSVATLFRSDTSTSLCAYRISVWRQNSPKFFFLGLQTLHDVVLNLTYGDRIQYSVFIVDIIPSKLLRLKDEIGQQVETSEDSVLFCDLGRLSELGEKRFSYVGQSRDTTDNDVLIL